LAQQYLEQFNKTIELIGNPPEPNKPRLHNIPNDEIAKKGAIKLPKDGFYTVEHDVVVLNLLVLHPLYFGDAVQYSVELLQLIYKICMRNLIKDDHGKFLLDNKNCVKDKDFGQFVNNTGILMKLSVGKLDQPCKIAFFLNLYNILKLHLMCVFGYPDDAAQLNQLENAYTYCVENQYYTLDQIKHNVLLAKGNERRQTIISINHSINKFDPAVLFAMIDFNDYSPPIQFYKRDTLEEQVRAQALTYLEKTIIYNKSKKELLLPPLITKNSPLFGERKIHICEWITELFGRYKRDCYLADSNNFTSYSYGKTKNSKRTFNDDFDRLEVRGRKNAMKSPRQDPNETM